jgi:hypothetical protein
MRTKAKMLFFVCERCKFSSPKSALCHTCGAKLKKESPTREVFYRVQDRHDQSVSFRITEICAQVGSGLVQTWNHFAKTKAELTKPIAPSLPPKNPASI